MYIYARMQNGIVAEIIPSVTWTNGIDIPIEQRFTSDIVATLVNVTTTTPAPQVGWTSSDGGTTFADPASQ